MHEYALGFISSPQLFQHVRATVEKYRAVTDLAAFNKNIIDPIKLTFDSKIYRKSIEESVEIEVVRPLDSPSVNSAPCCPKSSTT